MKINKEELFNLYMKWVNQVSEDIDWKTNFTPNEIVNKIATILENNPKLIENEGLCSGSYRHQEHHCCHADDDAEHGQEGAHLVGAQRPQGYFKSLRQIHVIPNPWSLLQKFLKSIPPPLTGGAGGG